MLKGTRKVRVWFTAAVFPLTLLFHTGAAIGTDPVRLAFSSLSATNAGFFTAIDEKLFERRGIDLTRVHIASSSVVMPAVLTREVDLANLRGKILGVSRFGGSLDISLRYGLQQVGLDPKRDNITLVQAGGMPEIMAGLTAGKLDGAMLLSVYAQRGKDLGFRELLDLGTLDVSFPQGVTLTTREFLRDKRDLAKRFMAAYLDGLELFLKNPRVGKKALARFTGVKEERFLDADYAQYTEKYLNKSMTTEPRMLSIVFDRIGVASAEEREKVFKGLVDNSILAE